MFTQQSQLRAQQFQSLLTVPISATDLLTTAESLTHTDNYVTTDNSELVAPTEKYRSQKKLFSDRVIHRIFDGYGDSKFHIVSIRC